MRRYEFINAYLPLAQHIRAPQRQANVAMFHLGRCGSSVLGDLLNQHPHVYWAGEIFEKMHKKYRDVAWCFEDPIKLIKLRMYAKSVPFFGFETKATPEFHLRPGWVDMELETYIHALRSLSFSRFVILKRNNYLRRLASALVGRKKGHFHSIGQVRQLVTIRIDVNNAANRRGDKRKTLLQYFNDMEDHYRQLQVLLQEHETLLLSYEEDIQENPQVAYQKMCAFFGVEPYTGIAVNLKKTTPFALHEVIENYREVQDKLQGTPYAWMLEEHIQYAS